MTSRAFQTFRRFCDNASGNVAMIFGLSVIPIVIVAGFAIDYQLVTTKKTKAQFTLDSAVIAASRQLQDGVSHDDVKAFLTNYYHAAMNSQTGSLTCLDPTITIEREDIVASTTCSQQTTLSTIAGIDELKFRVGSASQFGIGKVDVAFVFDVSGSMDGSRMASLKDAAKTAVRQLIPDNPATGHENDVRLAAVSYNNSMNAGSFFEVATGESSNLTYTYWDSDKGKYVDIDYTTTCVFQRQGTEKFTDAAPGPGKYVTPASYWDRNDCRAAVPVPLTNKEQPLIDYIDSLDPRGGTAGHLGVAWGWYMISPRWSALLPEPPLPYGGKDTAKALILMTDGAFNATVNNSQGSSTWQAKQICDNIKDEDIVLYAVAFQAPSAGQDVLKYCASGPEFYFEPDNGDELTEAYKAIATSISDLRLTQ